MELQGTMQPPLERVAGTLGSSSGGAMQMAAGGLDRTKQMSGSRMCLNTSQIVQIKLQMKLPICLAPPATARIEWSNNFIACTINAQCLSQLPCFNHRTA